MKYRRNNGLIVDAIRCDECIEKLDKDFTQLSDWIRLAYLEGQILFVGHYIYVKNKNGIEKCNNTDWIIKSAPGSKPKTMTEKKFEERYQKVILPQNQ